MLTVFLLVINSVRYALPVITMYGCAPTYFSFWILLRTITFTLCPTHIYRLCDDRFYSMYQRFLLFFFQNWVQTKVCCHTETFRLHYTASYKKKTRPMISTPGSSNTTPGS